MHIHTHVCIYVYKYILLRIYLVSELSLCDGNDDDEDDRLRKEELRTKTQNIAHTLICLILNMFACNQNIPIVLSSLNIFYAIAYSMIVVVVVILPMQCHNFHLILIRIFAFSRRRSFCCDYDNNVMDRLLSKWFSYEIWLGKGGVWAHSIYIYCISTMNRFSLQNGNDFFSLGELVGWIFFRSLSLGLGMKREYTYHVQ